MQCKATNKHGRRCRKRAVPGSEYCDTIGHGPEGDEKPDAPELTADPPTPTPLAEPTPAPAPPSAGDSGDVWSLFAALPPAPGPAAEPAAIPPPSPELPAAELEDSEPEPELPPAVAWVDTIPTPPPSGRWEPDDVARFLRWTVQPVLRRGGKEELSEQEIRDGGEALAPLCNQLLARVNPESPWGQAMLWAGVTIGPRYLPDLLAWIRPSRSSPAASSPAASSPAPPRAFTFTPDDA